jgi:hypothetical protein
MQFWFRKIRSGFIVVNVAFCPVVLTLSGFGNLTGLDNAAAATVVSSRPILFCYLRPTPFIFYGSELKTGRYFLRNYAMHTARQRGETVALCGIFKVAHFYHPVFFLF